MIVTLRYTSLVVNGRVIRDFRRLVTNYWDQSSLYQQKTPIRGLAGSVGLPVGVGCLDDASKQNIERFDVVVIESATVTTAHLPAAVTVVGRASFSFAGQLSTATTLKARITAQHRREYVVQIDVADHEQRSVPGSSA